MSLPLETADPTLKPFRDVTPGGVSRNCETSAWSLTAMDDILFLACVTAENRIVLRRALSASKWETSYERVTRARKDETEENPTLDAQWLPPGSSKTPGLVARLSSSRGTESLHITPDGGFAPIKSGDKSTQPALTVAPLAIGANEFLFDTAALRHRRRNAKSWKSLALPALPDSAQPSGIASAGGLLALTVDDARLGCSVWTTPAAKPGTWTESITRGGERFSLNASVLATAATTDGLYAACGSETEGAFEILRLYPDGTWDLIVGTPRVSRTGLKVPLSCHGPGMDEFEPARFLFLATATSQILLGTYDDLAGFRIWRSTDGITWLAGEAELVGIDRVLSAVSVPVPNGLALVLELQSPQHGHTRGIWLG